MNSHFSRARCAVLSLGITLTFPAAAQAACIGTSSGSPYTTAVGCGALSSNKGQSNTAAGYNAMQHNTTGTWNAATGALALQYNTTGSRNTAMGPEALLNNTTGSDNTSIGFLSLATNREGNGNTATGSQALTKNTSGGRNTANGSISLASNTTGSDNTAVGDSSLGTNATGSYNTAFGSGALLSNQGPTDQYTKGGTSNTAVGYFALNKNTTGWQNTAVGESVLEQNTTGAHNTGIGEDSLNRNTSGIGNTATGESTLYDNAAGVFNVANGYYALNHAAGNFNIAVGARSGCGLTSGDNNIYIGSFGSSLDTNVIRIGNIANQTVTCPDSSPFSLHQATYIAGIYGISGTGLPVSITASGQLVAPASSERFKKDIQPIGTPSRKILDLRPVTFRYKQADDKGAYPVQYGLIAEEVAKVFPELVQYDGSGAPFAVYYNLLTPILLAELQREHAEALQLRDEVASLRKQTMAQAEQFASFEKKFGSLLRPVRAGAN